LRRSYNGVQGLLAALSAAMSASLAAGFVFEGESNVLRNPADTHKLKVFDKSIRGHTDQFAYKFRKPE
jgi:predicted methyltransferase